MKRKTNWFFLGDFFIVSLYAYFFISHLVEYYYLNKFSISCFIIPFFLGFFLNNLISRITITELYDIIDLYHMEANNACDINDALIELLKKYDNKETSYKWN